MRRWLLILTAVVLAVPAVQAQGDAVKCKAEGLHLCCKGCEQTVQDTLGAIKGVSDIACDRPAKTVTFKARSEKIADEAVSALVNAGFCFKVSVGDKAFSVSSKTPSLVAGELVARNVHACCEQCEKAIEGLFKDAKVTFSGKGPQKDVTVTGKDLDAEVIQQRLQDAGFHGVVGPKKK